MAADSTWGIPKPVRSVLAARITELRVGLQEDARRQLAAFGITADQVGPPPGGRTLSADEIRGRDVVLAVFATRRDAGVSREEALQGYVEGVAFTLLDRLVTFRCLEERGLLLVDGQAESLVRRDPVRGTSSLVWRTRDAQPGLDERAVARTAYRAACAAMTDRVRVLFDPDDEPSALFPTLPLWQKAMDALNDPAIPPATFAADEIMGWVYQYWSTELKNDVYTKLANGGKIEDPKELAAATCLYTERYIVDYLVQNTLGATWVEMHPESALPATWPYYVTPPAGNPPIEREQKRVRDLTLIDPCVGSGHFLVRAFDLFAQLYAEEGIEKPDDVPGLILERNLYGADIDRRAVQIAALALYLKGCGLAGSAFQPKKLNLVACDIAIPPDPPADFLASLPEPELKDLARSLWAGLAGIRTFGSLLHPECAVNEAFAKLKARGKGTLWADDTDWAKKRAHFITELRRAFTTAAGDTDLGTRLFGEEASRGLDALQVLGRRYDVVVTNPPYQGASSLPDDLRALMNREYNAGRADLYAAFILRCRELACTAGEVGMVTQQSWMFLRTFVELRRELLVMATLRCVAHLGTGAFEEIGGAVVNTAAFAFRCSPSPPTHSVVATRAVAGGATAKAALLADPAGAYFVRTTSSMASIPEAPLCYWVPSGVFRLLANDTPLSRLADVKQGLSTADNDRYVRWVWEPGTYRLPAYQTFPKAGSYRKWSGLESSLVAWDVTGNRVRDFPRAYVRNERYYFKQGLTYGLMAQGSLAARRMDRSVFSDASSGVFSRDGSDNTINAIQSLLNSRASSYLLRTTTQDIKFREGYVSRLPVPEGLSPAMSRLSAACVALSVRRDRADPCEVTYRLSVLEADEPPARGGLPFLHALEGWNERLVFDAYELGPEDVQAVIDETGVPAGWNPLLVGYDALPEAPAGIEIPAGLTGFLATLEHRQLSAVELARVKARLRAMYEAGPGAKEEVEAPVVGDDDEEAGAALGARIPIPTETFLEELAVKMELHPISVHWLLEELRAQGVVSPPLRKAELEEYIDITLVRMLGYRWPEQDAYEAERGPILDRDLVDPDGIIPLVPCGDEPVAEERVRTRLVRQLGDDGADAFLADFRRYTKRDLAEWIRRDFFKAHTRRFKNRPIAWHLRSPEGAFEALVLYHRLSKDTLQKLRVTYAGDRLARLKADQQHAKDRGDTATVTTLQVAIEDVEDFRRTLEAIERGDDLRHRIRCRWKDETEAGRPGPYAPDIDDGVKVNIRPFQEAGLLPAKVISKW